MLLLISFCKEPDTINDPDGFFLAYDTEKKEVVFNAKLSGKENSENMTRGTGMCYFEDYFYGACIAKEHRVASRLVIVDTNTGELNVNKLQFTKAAHSINPFGKQGSYNMILVNSTQNDLISIVTTYKTDVITEDLFFDFMENDERIKFDWGTEYKYDDSIHNNCVVNHNGNIYASMFLDYKVFGAFKLKIEKTNWREEIKNYISKPKGAIYNLTENKCICNRLYMPHNISFNNSNELLYCNSKIYEVVNHDRNIRVKLKGFTRGLCEDPVKGGYWVGLSYNRHYSNELNGAALQFISYDMVPGEFIDLQEIGKEIYDILPYKHGRYF